MEKLLVCQALDERDFLEKKINDLVAKMDYIVVLKEKDTAYKGKPVDKLEEQIKADWQSAVDQIDRYNRICRAITQSNAVTEITFKDGKKMTIAEAITLKNINKVKDLKSKLLFFAQRAFGTATVKEQDIEKSQASRREDYITTQLNNQGDKKTIDEDFLKAIDQLMKPYNAKIVDPLGIEEKINALQAEKDAFDAEVETLIKISNATTFVEF